MSQTEATHVVYINQHSIGEAIDMYNITTPCPPQDISDACFLITNETSDTYIVKTYNQEPWEVSKSNWDEMVDCHPSVSEYQLTVEEANEIITKRGADLIADVGLADDGSATVGVVRENIGEHLAALRVVELSGGL